MIKHTNFLGPLHGKGKKKTTVKRGDEKRKTKCQQYKNKDGLGPHPGQLSSESKYAIRK